MDTELQGFAYEHLTGDDLVIGARFHALALGAAPEQLPALLEARNTAIWGLRPRDGQVRRVRGDRPGEVWYVGTAE